MLRNKTNDWLKKRWLFLTVFSIVVVSFCANVLAVPAAPGPPPMGKEWQWYEARWELVNAPPPGPYQYQHAHWENGVWVEGAWVPIKVRRNREWVAAHYDVSRRMWVEGYWARRSGGGVIIEERPKELHGGVPSAPPPGKVWVWVPAHWHLVEAAPPQPSKWVPAHWDARLGVWVEGAWVVLDTPAPAGRAWIAGHWDPVKGVWIEGGWGAPASPGVRPPRPHHSAGPGMVWVWDPVAGEWVARPR